MLISEHCDGEIIARIATGVRLRTVRGSTSRGAARALLGLGARRRRDGHDLAITPDGPRGPAKSFAPGADRRRAANRRADDRGRGDRIVGVAAQELGSASHPASRSRACTSRTATRRTSTALQTRGDAADDVDRMQRVDGKRRAAGRWLSAAFVEHVGMATTRWRRAARALLTPAERLFGGVVGARDMLYDAGWLPSHETPIPAISIGNLTVGGTGKTPIAAWIARGLARAGRATRRSCCAAMADDEPLVHRVAQSDVPGHRRRRSGRGQSRKRPRAGRRHRGARRRVSTSACAARRGYRSRQRRSLDRRRAPAAGRSVARTAAGRASRDADRRHAKGGERIALVEAVHEAAGARRAVAAARVRAPRAGRTRCAAGRECDRSARAATRPTSDASRGATRFTRSIAVVDRRSTRVRSRNCRRMARASRASVFPDHHAFH